MISPESIGFDHELYESPVTLDRESWDAFIKLKQRLTQEGSDGFKASAQAVHEFFCLMDSGPSDSRCNHGVECHEPECSTEIAGII